MTGKNNTPGDPCNGNSHQAYHIDHADVVAPGASTVVNNHTVIIRFTFTIRIIVSICIPPARYKISHPIRPGRGSPFRQSFILNQEDAFQIFRRIDILPIKKITYYIILSIRYIDPESFFHQFMLTMIYDSSSSSDSSVKITTCQTYFS